MKNSTKYAEKISAVLWNIVSASLEFHHREDLPQPPSLVATVLSRSTFDLTEVSLSHLPVIAVIEFAFQCLSPEDI